MTASLDRTTVGTLVKVHVHRLIPTSAILCSNTATARLPQPAARSWAADFTILQPCNFQRVMSANTFSLIYARVGFACSIHRTTRRRTLDPVSHLRLI